MREDNSSDGELGDQPYDQAVSFASWDTFFFTRSFISIESLRSVRHVSKVLTYPLTVAAALHQNGPFTRGNGRITREGTRNMVGKFCSASHMFPFAGDVLSPYSPPLDPSPSTRIKRVHRTHHPPAPDPNLHPRCSSRINPASKSLATASIHLPTHEF